MKITLINPNNVTQKGDFYGTGIPYIPIILSYVASYLKKYGHDVNVIDAFGEAPFQKKREGEFIIQGLNEEEIINRTNKLEDLICLYAGHVVEHFIVIKILKEIKKTFPKIPICIVENSQAVTAYSLEIINKEFFENGADFVIFGEPEKVIEELLVKLKSEDFSKVNGLIYKIKNKIMKNKYTEPIKNLDDLPFPAWDLFPIKNYWNLNYSHAPFQGKYLPLLTSRGCPFECNFCIIPFTNKRKWRARSAENVVKEINHHIKKYNVRDFHIEDLNPTIDNKRIQDICKLIIKEKLEVKIKFASGIKLDTINSETIKLLKKAGCNYISFSPESGSKKVLKLMNKPFDYEHGLEMTKLMNKLKIKTQACFVIGFPGETDEDRILTKDYIKKIIRSGIDEIALFVMTPIPGSKPYEYWQKTPKEISKFTFSPRWRKEYKKLEMFRRQIYFTFIIYKLFYHPIKLIRQPFNFFLRNFDTKMEMTLYRLFKTY